MRIQSGRALIGSGVNRGIRDGMRKERGWLVSRCPQTPPSKRFLNQLTTQTKTQMPSPAPNLRPSGIQPTQISATGCNSPTAATAQSTIDRFWEDCQFSGPSTVAGYQLHRISLTTLSDEARDALAAAIEHHYIEPMAFRSMRGGEALARSLEARLPSREDNPTAKKDRGGDLGELLAIEWLRRHYQGSWEVCFTLRWKESIRPRRGEDIIAIDWAQNPVCLLKGEAKAAEIISGATIQDARRRLDQDGGWPAPFTVDFLAERLARDGREQEAIRLYDERFVRAPRPQDPGCTHLLFLFSADDPEARVVTHGLVSATDSRPQLAAILVHAGYVAFRDGMHARAIELLRKRGTQ